MPLYRPRNAWRGSTFGIAATRAGDQFNPDTLFDADADHGEANANMNARSEFRFLQELRFLSGNARYYLARIEHESRRWQEADAAFERAANPRSHERANIYGSTEIAVQAQVELFAHTDALLATIGRIALILFGQGKRPKPVVAERTAHLQRILGIDSGHPVADKRLRNAWTHFDEHLDKLSNMFATTDQFVRSSALVEGQALSAMRTFEVDTLRLHFADLGTFELTALSGAIAELAWKVDASVASWASRWQDELNDRRASDSV